MKDHKHNRQARREAKSKNSFWCPACDLALVRAGQKCPACKKWIGPKRNKKSPIADKPEDSFSRGLVMAIASHAISNAIDHPEQGPQVANLLDIIFLD